MIISIKEINMALLEGSPDLSEIDHHEMVDELADAQERLQENGGVFVAEPLEPSELYQPVPGTFRVDKQKPLHGGTVTIGAYETERASHRVGIYTPDNYRPEAKLPKVLTTTPLGVGARGRSQIVGEEMMRAGFRVIKKAVPRYAGPITTALGLAEDANEMLGLMNTLEADGIIDPTEEIIPEGESQSGMKALAVLALAAAYGYDVADGLVIAPCYLHKINLLRPDRQVGRMLGMLGGTIRYISHTTPEERHELRGTFSIKDMHHHALVLPVLVSGETGTFPTHIPKEQKFGLELYGKDGHSHPHEVKAEFDKMFPNVSSRILAEYGHVDGIMSTETAARRDAMLFEIAQAHDVHRASLTKHAA